jgi:hypothetical protein
MSIDLSLTPMCDVNDCQNLDVNSLFLSEMISSSNQWLARILRMKYFGKSIRDDQD